MKLEFRATTECEAAALSGFLGRMFRLPAGAPDIALQHMKWKYWADRPDWAGPRSFAAMRNGVIVAHAAAWPTRVRLPDHVVPAAHLIDWAADPEYPGAGFWIMRQMAARVRLLIATGGSEITQRILPRIGFRPYGELDWFARPVRPLGQTLTTTKRNWRLPARLVRNALWCLARPLSLPRGWSVRPMAPEEIPPGLWPQPSPTAAVTARDAGFYRYVVQSPSVRHVLFGLEKGSEVAGYCCLALSPHVARIADLWLPSARVEDWDAAFRAAAVAAARHPDVYEVSAWASTALGREALVRAGFRSRNRLPVSLFGDGGILEGRNLHVQMLDCDASFLSGEAASYLT